MRARQLTALVLLLCVLAALFSGCEVRLKADISAYADTPIEISGLTDEEFTVTAQELAQLELVKVKAQGQTEKAGTVTGIGPTLQTFLAQYGRSIEEFKKIRFFCSDDYKIVLKGEYLTDYEIVMALCKGSDPLPKKQQPLRIVIPEAESGKWAYGVVRIEFVEA